MLLANDLLILELEQLSLLLEICHDLAKTLLQQVNLGFQQLDLLIFFKLLLSVLFHGLSLVTKLAKSCIVVKLKLSVAVVKIGELFVL